MTYANIAGIASGFALIAVAFYSLRLNRLMRTSKSEEEARQLEDKKRTEAAISLLEKKIADLTKANEQWLKSYGELEKVAAGFQADAAEQKRLATELADTNMQMALSHQEELRRSSAALQARVVEQDRLRVEQERLRVEQERSRAEQDRSQSQQVQLRAEMEKTGKQLAEALAACSAAQTECSAVRAECSAARAECSAAQANTTILKSVRALVNDATASVETVVDHVAKFRSTNSSHITKLLRPTAKKPGSRTAVNGLGKRLPISVAVLSRQLTREQSALVEQIDTLKKKLERIQKVAGEKPGTANGSHVLQCADTDTATTIEAHDSHDTARCTRDEANGNGIDHGDLQVLN